MTTPKPHVTVVPCLLDREKTSYMFLAVRDFHSVFAHPVNDEDPAALTPELGRKRVAMTTQECVTEYGEAIDESDIIKMLDSLIDTVYFDLGSLVAIGMPVAIEIVGDVAAHPRTDILAAAAPYAEKFESSMRSYLETYEDELWSLSVASCVQRITLAMNILLSAGYDPRPFFDEIHKSNMTKLGADGNPVHSRGYELDGEEPGKVIKGPNYVEPDLAKLL